MRSVDTNVLLRLIVTSDAAQTHRAQSIASEPMFLPLTVLIETGWVLRSSYAFDRLRLAAALLHLIALPTVVVDDEPSVRWAIGQVRDNGADLADMLHLVAARTTDRFATFDRKLAKQAGPDAPIEIETLD